jgi:hypothetical protein
MTILIALYVIVWIARWLWLLANTDGDTSNLPEDMQ